MKKQVVAILAVAAAVPTPDPAWAVDSYRYFHVTPETPWYIFLFLLPIVVSPFILMAVLYWYFAWRKSANRNDQGKE